MSAVKCDKCETGYLLPRLPTVIGDIFLFSGTLSSEFSLKDLPGDVVAAARLLGSQLFRAS